MCGRGAPAAGGVGGSGDGPTGTDPDGGPGLGGSSHFFWARASVQLGSSFVRFVRTHVRQYDFALGPAFKSPWAAKSI
jgi:hypothetical protein